MNPGHQVPETCALSPELIALKRELWRYKIKVQFLAFFRLFVKIKMPIDTLS